MEGYFVKFSGGLRFTDEMNFGLYIYENEEDPTDNVIVLINAATGDVIYNSADDGE